MCSQYPLSFSGGKSSKVSFPMETKQSVEEMRGSKLIYLTAACSTGGLTLLWMEEVNLHVQTFSMNHITLSSTTLISPRG